METAFNWTEPLIRSYSRLLQQALEYLPQLIAGILLLVLGWVVARLLRALSVRLATNIDRVLVRVLPGLESKAERPRYVPFVGDIVFWIVILLVVTAVTNVLDLRLFTGWLDGIIGHLPNILSGILIIVAGVVVANLVRNAVATAAASAGYPNSALLGRVAQAITLVTMVVVGVGQTGIDITALITVLAVGIGAVLGGAAIAFGFGSREYVANLVAAQQVAKSYGVGDRIRIGSEEGRVLELTRTAVVLDTANGRTTVPAKIFGEQPSVALADGASDG